LDATTSFHFLITMSVAAVEPRTVQAMTGTELAEEELANRIGFMRLVVTTRLETSPCLERTRGTVSFGGDTDRHL
jgi:hypothetical protein